MNRISLIIATIFVSFLFLPSCIEDDQYGEPLEVYGKGDNSRTKDIVPEEEEEEEEEENEDSQKFTGLTGQYDGILYSPISPEETNDLEVTVKANENLTFDLALYDALIDGMKISGLDFKGIPSKHNEKNDSWSFSLKDLDLSIEATKDGTTLPIEANVNVNGTVNQNGNLEFTVVIKEPSITLKYEGTQKK